MTRNDDKELFTCTFLRQRKLQQEGKHCQRRSLIKQD